MKPSHYEKILGVLIELKQAHPKCTMAKHLATALEENFWGMTDKEMLESLQKYQTNISLDVRHSDNDIDEIIKDAMNLTLHEDEEDD
jgi:hypothetical protein